MNCRRMVRLLSDHLEGLLPPREAAATAAHLSDCPACRSRLTALIALEADLRKLPELLPPSDVERQAIASWSAEQEAVARDSRTRLLSRRIPSPSLISCFGSLQPPARLASLGVGRIAAV